MTTIFSITPLDFFFSVYGILGIIATILLIVLTIIAIYALKKIILLGKSIENEVVQVKGKIKKSTKLIDVILDLFTGPENDEDEEVFVMKKKKK